MQVVAPEGWKPTKRDYDDFQVKIDGRFANCPKSVFFVAPIEQNVSGKNGYYQLEYTRKASKNLRDFKQR